MDSPRLSIVHFVGRGFAINWGWNGQHIYRSPDAEGTCDWDTHRAISGVEASRLISNDVTQLMFKESYNG